MIISDQHRYLFVEQPRTACTAIRAELLAYYGGRSILDKHATYTDFLRVATPEQKRYFVFSGIRNPLDERVSIYFKYRANQGRYRRLIRTQAIAERQREAFEYVTDEQADFASYLRRFCRRPYDNDTLIHHARMDQLIRFEHLQEDFGLTLQRLGLEQLRAVPLVNETGGRGAYLDYYGPEIRPHAAWVFGPFMRKWGYELPAEWTGVRVPRSAFMAFQIQLPFRYANRRYLRNRSGPAARAATAAISRVRRSAFDVFGW